MPLVSMPWSISPGLRHQSVSLSSSTMVGNAFCCIIMRVEPFWQFILSRLWLVPVFPVRYCFIDKGDHSMQTNTTMLDKGDRFKQTNPTSVHARGVLS